LSPAPGNGAPGARAIGSQRTVLRNIGILGIAQVATMLLNVVALVHIARTVGETWFGVLQWGVAFSSYALIVGEWGLATLAVREISRLDAPDAVRRYAGTHLGLMLALGAAVLVAGALALPLFAMYRTDPVIALGYLATVVPFALSLDWVGIGLERLGTVSVVKTLRSLLYAAAVLALLRGIDGLAGWPAPRWVPVFFWVAWLVSAMVMAWRARRWLGRSIVPRAGPFGEWRRRLVAAGPIGAGALTLRVLLNVDVILLGVLATPAAVGNYAAAAKVVFVLTIAVEVVWKALLPRLSRAWRESPDLCRRRFCLYLGLVMLGFLPLAVGGALLGNDVMAMLYGDRFPEAGLVCRILSVSYVALAIGQFFGNGLIATDRQRQSFLPVAAGAAAAVVGVVGLAPRGGGGAALGMLAAHLILMVATTWVGRDLLVHNLVRPVLVAALGSIALGAVLAILPAWPLLARVALGSVLYAGIVVPLGLPWLRREARRTGL